jgi:hypothetical protein
VEDGDDDDDNDSSMADDDDILNVRGNDDDNNGEEEKRCDRVNAVDLSIGKNLATVVNINKGRDIAFIIGRLNVSRFLFLSLSLSLSLSSSLIIVLDLIVVLKLKHLKIVNKKNLSQHTIGDTHISPSNFPFPYSRENHSFF